MSKMNVKVSTKAKLKFTAAFLITLFLLFSNYSGMNNTAKAATCSRAFNELTIACTPYTKKGNLPFAFMHCLAKEMNKAPATIWKKMERIRKHLTKAFFPG